MTRFTNQWLWPCLWILLIPVLTVPLTLRLLGGLEGCTSLMQTVPPQFRCSSGAALLSLGPGLLNLVPALWLWSSQSPVRAAARMTLGLGALRLLVPVAMYLGQGAEVRIVYGVGWLPTPNSTLVSAGLWILSLCAVTGFVGFTLGRQTRGPDRSSVPPPATQRNEPGLEPAA